MDLAEAASALVAVTTQTQGRGQCRLDFGVRVGISISFLTLFVGESRTSVDFTLYEIGFTTSALGSEGDSFLNFRRRNILLVPH